MTGMPNSVAVRNGSVPAPQQPGAALELRAGQTMWTRDQHAALVAMGIPAKATSAELGVFLHQCQRLRLDPFTKQIYLIYRKVKEGDRWVDKPTTQIGIDGFRITRDRIAREQGLRVEYQDTIWYAPDGQPSDVWLWDYEPAACKFTVLVDGRRFPAVLRFNEYCQRNRDGDRTGRWRDGFAHQIEKCAEADALRRAFPNDLSGVILEDAVPLAEDAPEPRQRVTAADARARAPRTVTATVVTPDVPPAGEQPPPPAAPASPPEPAGGTPGDAPGSDRHRRLVGLAQQHFKRLGYADEDRDARLGDASKVILGDGYTISSLNDLTPDELEHLVGELGKHKDRASLLRTLADGEVTGGQ